MREKAEGVTKPRNPLHYLYSRGPNKKRRPTESCTIEGKPAVRIPVGLKAWALVDPEDASEVYAYRWTPSGNYAKRRSKRPQFMHRLVADMAGILRDGLDIDHKNGNGLDNRRCNLRAATRAENLHNMGSRSGRRFKGICLTDGKWVATIRAGTHKTYLGRFTDEVEAALAYDRAARELHGEFARLNFPEHSAI